MLAVPPSIAQQGAKNGEWRYYGGDSGTTKYSPLDQINAANVSKLQIAWQWHADNFGKLPDHNWEVTPLMIGGVLYFTAGSRRDAVAVDAATGETLWMYRLDEGPRGNFVARTTIVDSRTGPMAKATTESSMSRPAISSSRSTRRLARLYGDRSALELAS